MTDRRGNHQLGRLTAPPRPDLLAEAIEEIELGLQRDDPRFLRRMGRLRRASKLNAIGVVGFLVASAVLLTAALATRSLWAWIAGSAAFLAAFAVDDLYRRAVGLGRGPAVPAASREDRS